MSQVTDKTASATAVEMTPEQLEKKKQREERKKAIAAEKKAKFAAKKAAAAAAASGSAKQQKQQNNNKKKAPAKGNENIAYVNITPKGEKKDVGGTFPTSYQPEAVESAWYDWWDRQGYFSPSISDQISEVDNDKEKEMFVMCIPPANVTGSLHLGHTLLNAVEDSLVRWHRMKGHVTLWLPGTDHAGIATQVAVEKKIARDSQGKQTRHDLGREKFVEEVWKWKKQYGDRISSQLRRLGSSLDWNREVFTMDTQRIRAVDEAFIRMYRKGLIYRSNRLVNWCCALKTAISDIEVEYSDIPGPTQLYVPGHEKKVEFGVLVEFAYKIISDPSDDKKNEDEEVVVATTRLETMLGDTGIAVHPDDSRYTHLVGKFAVHPFIKDRKIPIVSDSELVDMSFGTGCVKITPAHDPNDYECGKRNQLEFINILNSDGTMNENAGKFSGMHRFLVREKILADLKEMELYRGTSPNPMRIGFCQRSKDVIEPCLVPQWYVKCGDLAVNAIEKVKTNEIEIIPSNMKDTWFRWLENIRDWCISRQLWWGHRIPAYLVSIDGRKKPDPCGSEDWIIAHTETEAIKMASEKYGVEESKISLSQDPDVLDTWFSSGLYPFASFGWPDDTPELKLFYPNTLLETGHDILFFWVARMVMMADCLTGQSPFKKVFLHAMVRDAHGRKMSKSLGNVIDPIDVIDGISLEGLHKQLYGGNLDPREIEKAIKGQKADFPSGISRCGADALRFALVVYTTQGRNINLDIQRVVGYRNFCNKIWNAVRFALCNLSEDFVPLENVSDLTKLNLSLMDKWILSRLASAINDANVGMASYDFSGAASAAFNFILYDLCDIYLETVKPMIQSQDYKIPAMQTLYLCLDYCLRLLHPFLPFLTEELWQRIPKKKSDKESIMISKYPELQDLQSFVDKNAEMNVELMMNVVKVVRSIRSTYLLPRSKRPLLHLCVVNETKLQILENYRFFLEVLSYSAGENKTIISSKSEHPHGCAFAMVSEDISAYLSIRDMIDIPTEVAKLEKRLAKIEKDQLALNKTMNMDGYTQKAPKPQQEKDQKKIEALNQELQSCKVALHSFKSLMKEAEEGNS